MSLVGGLTSPSSEDSTAAAFWSPGGSLTYADLGSSTIVVPECGTPLTTGDTAVPLSPKRDSPGTELSDEWSWALQAELVAASRILDTLSDNSLKSDLLRLASVSKYLFELRHTVEMVKNPEWQSYPNAVLAHLFRARQALLEGLDEYRLWLVLAKAIQSNSRLISTPARFVKAVQLGDLGWTSEDDIAFELDGILQDS